jgi:hypothetical protein
MVDHMLVKHVSLWRARLAGRILHARAAARQEDGTILGGLVIMFYFSYKMGE